MNQTSRETPMICELHGSVYTVTVTNAELCDFARSWPCSRFDTDGEYLFQYDVRNGDLVDLSAVSADGKERQIGEDEDGEWMAALSEEAGMVGADELGLRDVIAIRYPAMLAAGV